MVKQGFYEFKPDIFQNQFYATLWKVLSKKTIFNLCCFSQEKTYKNAIFDCVIFLPVYVD